MDATIREMALVSIHNNIAEGREPFPHADDSQEVQDLYRQEVYKFKVAYGQARGYGISGTRSEREAVAYQWVIDFETTWGVSVIELEHKRQKEYEEFGRLSPWERAPETWASA